MNGCLDIFICRDLEEALEMGMDWSLREGTRQQLILVSVTG